MGSSGEALRGAIDMKVSEVFRYDFFAGLIVGGAGGLAIALVTPERLGTVMVVAIGLVGVIIGAVVAGIAVIAAFLDGIFLRKLRAIPNAPEPTYYFGPLLFTAVLGVVSCLLALVAVALPSTLPGWLLGPVGSLAGMTGVWTIVSLVPALATLTEFVLLKDDASAVPDEVVADAQQPRLEGTRAS